MESNSAFGLRKGESFIENSLAGFVLFGLVRNACLKTCLALPQTAAI
jgi:hypothetical protein